MRNLHKLFRHFVTTLNDDFEQELTLEDEGYESGSESLIIFPLPYAEHHAYVMFQHVKICLLDLPHLEHTHLNNLTSSSQCITIYHLKKMTTPH